MYNMSRIEELRTKLDEVDKELISLLIRRYRIVDEIMIEKVDSDLDARDEEREEEHLQRLKRASGGLDNEFVEVLYELLTDYSVEIYELQSKIDNLDFDFDKRS